MSTIVEATMSVSELNESEMIAMLLKASPTRILHAKRAVFPTIPIHMASFSALPSMPWSMAYTLA